jgi:ELWxxDGT repeat protein
MIKHNEILLAGKKFIHFSLVTAMALYFGACGGSMDIVEVEKAGTGTELGAGLADKGGMEGVVQGTGVVQAITVPTGDTSSGSGSGVPVTVETGRFLRADDPVYKSLFFPADNGVTGTELYKYDLTGENVLNVWDINPGSDSNPKYLTEVSGKLYFSADNGADGRELWIYDGNTNMATIRNINPTSGAGSDPTFITELNGKLYFSGEINAAEGRELCYYDIASNAWGYVTNHIGNTLNPTGGSDPQFIKKQDGVLYFSADDGSATGRELYRYDPVNDADTGPVLVADIAVGSSDPVFMAEVNGKIFFRANNAMYGDEVFFYDSLTGVHNVVKDINVGSGDSFPMFLTEVDGVIYLGASSSGISELDLWKIDTTKIGNPAQLVSVFASGTGDSLPGFLTEKDGKLYFVANDGTAGQGDELFTYDIATHDMTSEDLALTPGFSSAPFWMIEANGMLYFGADDLLNGRELWKSDGENPSEIIGNFNNSAAPNHHFLPKGSWFSAPVGSGYYGAYPTWTHVGIIKTTW